MTFNAAAARALMPQTDIDRIMDQVLARIKLAAQSGQESVIFTDNVIRGAGEWTKGPGVAPVADEVVRRLEALDFKVQHFHSDDDGPNRPAWDGLEIRW